MASRALQQWMVTLRKAYPWTLSPLIIQAPMRVLAGPTLAVAISEAGGLGFIGPGEKPDHLEKELDASKNLAQKSSSLKAQLSHSSTPILPIGFGIQTWAGNLDITQSILQKVAGTHPPCAAWLFAPRNGQCELDTWTQRIREVSPRTQIWIQVASVTEALAAARSANKPDVLVIQGSDAGGHSRIRGASILTLLPEVADVLAAESLHQIPLVAAGGIADARGAAAAFVLGTSGVVMGTRFLATKEVRINEGYQRAVLEGSDGGQSTVKTQLWNHLRGTMDWPDEFNARGLVNASWRDHESGLPFEKNKELHNEAMKRGANAWGEREGRTATYAGTNVGLIKDVKKAGEIVVETRDYITNMLESTFKTIRTA